MHGFSNGKIFLELTPAQAHALLGLAEYAHKSIVEDGELAISGFIGHPSKVKAGERAIDAPEKAITFMENSK